ncbi:hypothetical protein FLW53_09815 [Microbispora sp. SCL1-1]|uniref:hypothetical protein n=1 Tax=unclassified Microbispora TaxID=2614687 RepID=UPI00115A321E|nr:MULTISPECIES: hypothetical protein [unclassified Microbispora]NJP24503.1 hypothetical protein [Microbispora sp. CL1-1]TQS14647.1 hypothetical protein FLW53_09815 [Microbispora sp. SCL1-1]
MIPREEPPAKALYAVRTSFEWLNTWRYVLVQPSVKHVGFAAATFSNRRGHRVFPGVKRLMVITGNSKPSVINALATLRWLGFLFRVESSYGSEGRKADKYQLSVPRSLAHLPMADSKSGEPPSIDDLGEVARHVAVRLGVVNRLRLPVGQMTQPVGQLIEPTEVKSFDQWWLSHLTPTTQRTNTGFNHTDHQHSDRHDRRDSGESRRKYDFTNEDDCFDYVYDAFGDDLDPFEASMADGMLAQDYHPKAIVNTIRRRREDA